jgi:YggT family protein
MLIFRVITSYMPLDQRSAPVQFLYAVTEPLLAPIRRAFGLITIGGVTLDVSPIIVLIFLDIVRRLLYMI